MHHLNSAYSILLLLLISTLLTISSCESKTIAQNISSKQNVKVQAKQLLQSQTKSEALPELVQLQFLFRHGDRTPTSFYPNDPYANYSFPEGWGALFSRGIDRMHSVGVAVAHRYQDFMSKTLSRHIAARTSPKRRVVESNLAFLSGLMPPNSPEWIWSNSTELARLWQPIAVAMNPPLLAYDLGEDGPCPNADQYTDRENELPRVSALFERYSDLLSNLSTATGANLTSAIRPVGDLYDTLYCEQNYFGTNFIKPDWLTPETYQTLKLFREMQFSLFGDLPEHFLRLKAGPFLKELLEAQKKALELPSMSPISEEYHTVFTYSTHDRVLAIIMNALGLFQEQANYGSGMVFELRGHSLTNETQESDLQVHLLYMNVTDSENSQQQEPNIQFTYFNLSESPIFAEYCQNRTYCGLDGFRQALTRYIPGDIEEECGAKSSSGGGSALTFTIVMPWVFLVMFSLYTFE